MRSAVAGRLGFATQLARKVEIAFGRIAGAHHGQAALIQQLPVAAAEK
jgi:hypothetical protein